MRWPWQRRQQRPGWENTEPTSFGAPTEWWNGEATMSGHFDATAPSPIKEGDEITVRGVGAVADGVYLVRSVTSSLVKAERYDATFNLTYLRPIAAS